MWSHRKLCIFNRAYQQGFFIEGQCRYQVVSSHTGHYEFSIIFIVIITMQLWRVYVTSSGLSFLISNRRTVETTWKVILRTGNDRSLLSLLAKSKCRNDRKHLEHSGCSRNSERRFLLSLWFLSFTFSPSNTRLTFPSFLVLEYMETSGKPGRNDNFSFKFSHFFSSSCQTVYVFSVIRWYGLWKHM